MRENSGPPCPKPPRVRELIEQIGENVTLSTIDEHDLIDALDWLATMLENRTLYHKRQQIKNKVLRGLAKEYGLDDEVNMMTTESMQQHIMNLPPDAEDMIDLGEMQKLDEDEKT